MGRFLRALRAADLTDEQRSRVAEVRRELGPTEAERNAAQALQQALADGIRSGELAQRLVRARSAELGPVRVAQRKRQARALEALHDLLAPRQRAQLVAALGGSAEAGALAADDETLSSRELDEDRAPPLPRHRTSGRSAPASPARTTSWARWGPLAEMVRQLELSREQVERLDRAWGDVALERPSPAEQAAWRASRRAARATLLAAFTADELDAGGYFRGPFEQRRKDRLELEMGLLEVLLPVLTVPQRAALARMVLERAP